MNSPHVFVRNHSKEKDVFNSIDQFFKSKIKNIKLNPSFKKPFKISLENNNLKIDGKFRDATFFCLNDYYSYLEKYGYLYLIMVDAKSEQLEWFYFENDILKNLFTGESLNKSNNHIMLSCAFKHVDLPFYFFDFNKSFSDVEVLNEEKCSYCEGKWKDQIFSPKFLNIVEMIGSYWVFYKEDTLKVNLYHDKLIDFAETLDSLIRIQTPLNYRLDKGVLTLDTTLVGASKSFLEINLESNNYCRDELFSYSFALQKL